MKSAGAYFIIAAVQVGFAPATTGACRRATRFTADYWVALNGAKIDNSNVRMVAAKAHKDVIVTQGVGTFKNGDKVSILGSGIGAQAEYILPPGEPAIPSIIFTMYKI